MVKFDIDNANPQILYFKIILAILEPWYFQ